jgi:release factor glutamine methyltransferase
MGYAGPTSDGGRADRGRRHRPGLLADGGGVDLIVANPLLPTVPNGPEVRVTIRTRRCSAAGRDGGDRPDRRAGGPAAAARGQVGVEHDDTTSAATVDMFERHGGFQTVTHARI